MARFPALFSCGVPPFHARAIRFVASYRTVAPALPIALVAAIGQAAVWFLDSVWSAAAIAIVGLWLLYAVFRGKGGVAIALTLGCISAYPSTLPRPPVQERDDGVVFGVVDSVVRRSVPGEVRFELLGELDGERVRLRCRAVDLPWRHSAELRSGDRIWVRGTITPVRKPLNPFSWEAWLWRRGIDAECRALFLSRAEFREPSTLDTARQYVLDRVRRDGGDTRGTGLLLSMALGYHDILSATVERAFMSVGLTHLLVVSGYQVSVVFGCVVALLSCLSGRGKAAGMTRGVIMACACIAAALYVSFIGSEMSAIRALVAAVCACGQLLTERSRRYAQRWGIALLCMELIWPWCFFEIGVILTFAALLGIGIGQTASTGSRLPAYAWVTCMAWVCTTAVVVMWSGVCSPLSLVLNLLLAAPWSVLNCVIGTTGLVLLVVYPPLGVVVVSAVSWLNEVLATALISLSESPFASWTLEGTSRLWVSAILVTTALYVVVRTPRFNYQLR